MLYESMAQGVIYYDKNGKRTAANPAAAHILGLRTVPIVPFCIVFIGITGWLAIRGLKKRMID